MLKKINLLILFVACFIVTLFSFTNVEAGYNANSKSGSGSFKCTSNCGGGGGPYKAHDFSNQTGKYPGIYVRLVYYDPNGAVENGFDLETNQKIIVSPTKVYPYKTWKDGELINKYSGAVTDSDPSAFDNTTNKWMHTEWVPPTRYIDFDAAQFEKDTVAGNDKSPAVRKAQFEKFLEKMGEIDSSWKDVKLENLTDISCEVDKTGNCYHKAGYRLIAELYMAVNQSDGYRNSALFPSKSLELEVPKSSIDNAKSKNEFGGMSKYMHINWSDINYKCFNQNGGASNSGSAGSTECLFDKNCGYGVWIVDISSILAPTYDYDLDMACENCSSTTNKSLIIQDTTNWRDIFETDNIDEKTCGKKYKNIKEYFIKKTYGSVNVYCREEYHVTYPNANNTISLMPGRYFTVNETQGNLNNIDSPIPNFAPIEVERIRECRDNAEGKKLKAFNNEKFDNFKNCVPGKIKLNYDDKTYKYQGDLDNRRISSDSYIDGNLLVQKVKYGYRLKSGTYQYIRMKDGLSLDKKPSKSDLNKNAYKDLLVSNLPVSLSNTSKSNKLNLVYELPTDSKCETNIKVAYDKPNEYLKCTSRNSKENNVYNSEDPNTLKDTACSKLYETTDLNNKKFSTCVSARKKGNKMGNCKSFNTLCTQKDSNKRLKCEESKNYICDLCIGEDCNKCNEKTAGSGKYKNYHWEKKGGICCENGKVYADKDKICCDKKLLGDDGSCSGKPTVCNKNTAGKKTDRYDLSNMEWQEKDGIGKCCKKGTVLGKKNGGYVCCAANMYRSETGVCLDAVDECTKNTYKALGRDWNESENKCCGEGLSYNESTKKCVPKIADKCSKLGCPSNKCCYDSNSNPYCAFVIKDQNGNDQFICPGKPKVLKEPIFRTIDTSYPFTSQNGSTRNTGENWCSNSSISGIKSSCSGSSENNTVSTVITDKKGLTEENAMYKIHLDSNSISEIRKYNSKNSYDDFTLECNNKGDECLSNFIRNSSYGELTGKCSGPYFGNC